MGLEKGNSVTIPNWFGSTSNIRWSFSIIEIESEGNTFGFFYYFCNFTASIVVRSTEIQVVDAEARFVQTFVLSNLYTLKCLSRSKQNK